MSDTPAPSPSVDSEWILNRSSHFPMELRSEQALPLLPSVAVTGIASAVRTAHEAVLATHILLRALVGAGGADGVRALLIEGTDPPYNTAAALDRWVTTGSGDPVALLRGSQPFLHNTEALQVLRWLRSYAVDHPDDPVRVVHDIETHPDPEDLAAIELDLARRDLEWHQRTAQRVVHWGGTAHLVAADERQIPGSPEETHRNAGGHLRAALGSDYVVVALAVGGGEVPFRLAPIPADFTEAVFARAESPVLFQLGDLAAAPEPVRRWAQRPLRTRSVGPSYDPQRNADHRIDAGPVGDCLDLIVYLPAATAVTPLVISGGGTT